MAVALQHDVPKTTDRADLHVADQPEQTDQAEHAGIDLDAGFGRAIALGYALGVPFIFAFVAILIALVSDLEVASILAIAGAVSFWIGVMGGVVAVGLWSGRHEHEIFG